MNVGGKPMAVSGGSSKNQAQQESWDSAVRVAVKREIDRRGDWKTLIDVPLRVTMEFRLRRPKGQFKPSGDLKMSSLGLKPMRKPDLDKLARCTLDAMTASVFHDDSQVVELMTRKRYFDGNEGEGASIFVEIL